LEYILQRHFKITTDEFAFVGDEYDELLKKHGDGVCQNVIAMLLKELVIFITNKREFIGGDLEVPLESRSFDDSRMAASWRVLCGLMSRTHLSSIRFWSTYSFRGRTVVDNSSDVFSIQQQSYRHTLARPFGLLGLKEESASFQAFWGEKSELRRFKDGSILESLVWSEVVILKCRWSMYSKI
jgi:hypothetical protein